MLISLDVQENDRHIFNSIINTRSTDGQYEAISNKTSENEWKKYVTIEYFFYLLIYYFLTGVDTFIKL